MSERSTAWKRENVLSNRLHAQRWYRSFDGKISATYAGMRQRVNGKGRVETLHIYQGLTLLSRDEFIEWSKNDNNFNRLYAAWVDDYYPLTTSPSIDRIDASAGYTIGNLQWITHSENSKKAAIERHYKAAA